MDYSKPRRFASAFLPHTARARHLAMNSTTWKLPELPKSCKDTERVGSHSCTNWRRIPCRYFVHKYTCKMRNRNRGKGTFGGRRILPNEYDDRVYERVTSGRGATNVSARSSFGRSQAFQNVSARTRSDTDAAHMRKAPGVMQMRQTRQMQVDEDACIRNWTDEPTSRESHSLYTATR